MLKRSLAGLLFLSALFLFLPDLEATPEWDLRVYNRQHAARMTMASSEMICDGAAVTMAAPLSWRGDRAYVPLLFLKYIGMGSVSWNSRDRFAEAEFLNGRRTRERVRFRPGASQISRLDSEGWEYPENMAAKAVILSNRLLLPIRVLCDLTGADVHYAGGVIYVSWNEARVEVRRVPSVTRDQNLKITLLCQRNMGRIDIIKWRGGRGEKIPGDSNESGQVVLSGKAYSRCTLVLLPEPGLNIFEVFAAGIPSGFTFSVRRSVDAASNLPVKFFSIGSRHARNIIRIESPQSGFLETACGPLTVKGTIIDPSCRNRIILRLFCEEAGLFKAMPDISLSTADGIFNSVLSIDNPGSYILYILGEIPHNSGKGFFTAELAEIAIEAK